MLILALDSSGAACSAAVANGSDLLSLHRRAAAIGQAELLLPLVEATLAEAGVGYAGLDRVAVTVGPGSFTGIRVGLAAATGIAFAADKPLVGVTAFRAVAWAVPASAAPTPGRPLLVALDSRRDELFVQWFAGFGAAATEVGPPAAVLPSAIAETAAGRVPLVTGDAAERAAAGLVAAGVAAQCVAGSAGPDAAAVAGLAAAGVGLVAPVPLYLRAPDVSHPAGRPAG